MRILKQRISEFNSDGYWTQVGVFFGELVILGLFLVILERVSG